MAGKTNKINGTGKVILLRLDNIDTALQEIKVQLKDMSGIQTLHSVTIQKVETEQKNTIENFKNHEESHWKFATLVVASAGVISGIIIFVFEFISKMRGI